MWFLICFVFGNMPYMLFCGLSCLREHTSAGEGEGFHTTFGEKEGRMQIKTGKQVN
jgi:hypothetical protein